MLNDYTVHDLSYTVTDERWQARLFINNLFDKDIVTAVREDRSYLTDVGGVNFRKYGRYVAAPRSIGVGVVFEF